jgi:AcrR family transcriptional regulator
VETLLETSTRILERQGDEGLTTNHIAEQAGYSIGTLYQYFPSKEAIIVVLVRRHRERTLRDLARLLARAKTGEITPDEALRGYVRQLIEAFGRGQRAWRVLMRLGWQLDAPALFVQTMDEGAARIATTLRELPDAPWPVPTAARLFVLTRAVMGVIRSACLEKSSWLDMPDLEDELVGLVRGVLGQMATP